MTGKGMEKFFKITFGIGIALAMIFVVGVFLLILKFILLFAPEINLMGMTIINS